MKNQKILIFSDVHTHIDKAQKIIDSEGADLNICLGDIFDEFYDTPEQNANAAKWLKNHLYKDNFICLKGNHDLMYNFSNLYTQCSGYSDKKCFAINEILTKDDWNKLKWFYYLDDYLLTHAGLSNYWKKLYKVVNKNIPVWIESESKMAQYKVEKMDSHWFFRAGKSRLGLQECGGITWCDVNQEFKPISGIKQIFGHTPSQKVKIISLKESVNSYCIDSFLNQYLIYFNGEIQVKNYIDL